VDDSAQVAQNITPILVTNTGPILFVTLCNGSESASGNCGLETWRGDTHSVKG